MESYGTILKQARESKKVDLSTASRETSISRDYLEALENENSEIFHGEAYLIGFLRNYAEYLDIKPDRLISLYRNMKIQESGVPDELIRNLNPEPKTPIIIWSIIGGIVLIFCVLYFAVYRPKQIAKERAYAISEKTQPKIYEVTNQPLNARLYIGDQLSIETKTGKAILTVVSDNNSDLQLNTPSGLQHFELSETRELDCDGDSKPDVVIDVWEISSTEKSRGAEIYVMVKDNDIPLQELDNTTIPLNNASTNVNQVVILEDNRAYPFTMNASFRNPCVFRYEIDRKDSVENYYSNGDVVTMTANNKVRGWISNGNTVKFQVIAASQTYELEIGKAGEVIVQDVKWVRTDTGRYRLVVENVD